MKALIAAALWFVTFPVSVVGYNAYVSNSMEKDLPKIERDAITGIRVGAEPVFLKGDRPTAILMIHGFNGSPTDFGRLPKLLNQAGFTVSALLLPGHGRDPRELDTLTSEELIRFVNEAYQELKGNYDEVILMGSSMGGSLSILTALNQIETPVSKLVLFSPYFRLKHYWYYLVPPETHHKVAGRFVPDLKQPAFMRPIYSKVTVTPHVAYRYTSSNGVTVAMEIADLARERMESLDVPTLILHSKKDTAVDYETTREVVDELRSENIQLVTLEESNHVLLQDLEYELVENKVLEFMGVS